MDPATSPPPKRGYFAQQIERWLDRRSIVQKSKGAQSRVEGPLPPPSTAHAVEAASDANGHATTPPSSQIAHQASTQGDVDPLRADIPTVKVTKNSLVSRPVLLALPSLGLIAAAVYMGFVWNSEYQESTGSELQSQPSRPQSKSSATVDSQLPTEPGAPLPLERVAAALNNSGGVTVIDGPAPQAPVPQAVLQREGLPLERKIPTVMLSSSAPPGVPNVSAPPAQNAKVANTEKYKEERVDRVVVVDASEIRNADGAKDADAASTRKFAAPVEVKAEGPKLQLPASKASAPTPSGDATHQAGTKARNEKVTVVDIPPDSSYVLITNPQTRLPQRFTVGQKIWTGETIKSIDSKAGHLVLDSRTVSME